MYSLKTRTIKILKKKKTPGDIIILNNCTKNHDHMLYCSWDMARHGCNCYFYFWTIFCPFIPLTAQKIKISKKWKKCPQDVIILHKCPKIMITWYTAPEIWGVTDVIVIFDFWLFFALLLEKWKFQKKEKNTWGYHHFTQLYQKSWSYATLFLRYGTWWM